MARHDRAELKNAVASVKASFKALDISGTKMDKQVARARERLLTQILSGHHARKHDGGGQRYVPRYPTAGSRPLLAPALPVGTLGEFSRRPRVADEEEASECDSEASASSTSSCLSTSERGAHALAGPGLSQLHSMENYVSAGIPTPSGGSPKKRSGRRATSIADPGSMLSVLLATDRRGSLLKKAAAPSERSGQDVVVPGDDSCADETAANRGNEDALRNVFKAGTVASTPRVQLHVAANRPFSAPRPARWGHAPRPGRPQTAGGGFAAGAGHRQCLAQTVMQGAGHGKASAEENTHRLIQGSAALPCNGAVSAITVEGRRGKAAAQVALKLRPTSAFSSLQCRRPRAASGPRTAAPVCEGTTWEPQARWMATEGACRAV